MNSVPWAENAVMRRTFRPLSAPVVSGFTSAVYMDHLSGPSPSPYTILVLNLALLPA